MSIDHLVENIPLTAASMTSWLRSTALTLGIAALTSGCVIHVDESNEFGRGNFLDPFVGVETHPYVQGEDWAGWAKVRYKITHTTCPEENRGTWIDGAFGWVEITGSDVMLGFDGFPPLEGTMKGSKAPLTGEMIFMANDTKTRCVVGGDVELSGHEMGGEVEEELSGGIACVTRAKYSVQLPEAQ